MKIADDIVTYSDQKTIAELQSSLGFFITMPSEDTKVCVCSSAHPRPPLTRQSSQERILRVVEFGRVRRPVYRT